MCSYAATIPTFLGYDVDVHLLVLGGSQYRMRMNADVVPSLLQIDDSPYSISDGELLHCNLPNLAR